MWIPALDMCIPAMRAPTPRVCGRARRRPGRRAAPPATIWPTGARTDRRSRRAGVGAGPPRPRPRRPRPPHRDRTRPRGGRAGLGEGCPNRGLAEAASQCCPSRHPPPGAEQAGEFRHANSSKSWFSSRSGCVDRANGQEIDERASSPTARSTRRRKKIVRRRRDVRY